jgi:hypothetical protein
MRRACSSLSSIANPSVSGKRLLLIRSTHSRKKQVVAGRGGNYREVGADPRNQHYRACRDEARPKILLELSA